MRGVNREIFRPDIKLKVYFGANLGMDISDILSIGYRPLESMASKLADCGAVIYEIGDGNHVGNIMTAIQDAYEVAYHL